MLLEDFRNSNRIATRFWKKVDTSQECWLWQAGVGVDGYGKFGLVRLDGRQYICHAHRVAYLLEHGEVPDELGVCHRCDIPLCVRHAHLFLGTQTVNLQDMTDKGRRRYREHPGVENGRALCTEEQVLTIRDLFDTGVATRAELARRFGLGWKTVDDIVKRVHWKHI